MKKVMVLKRILAFMSSIALLLSPVSAMQVQAADGTQHKAYSKVIDAAVNPTEKMYFVEDGGSIQSFCLNGNYVFPPFLPEDEAIFAGYNPTKGMYNEAYYQYTKREIGRITTETEARKLNILVGTGHPSKTGEELRRWLLAVIEYYNGAYAGDVAPYGITKGSLMYVMAVQHGIWKVTDFSRKDGGVEEEYATADYFARLITATQTPDIKQKVSDWLADEATIAALMDESTPQETDVLLAKQVVGALKTVEKLATFVKPDISEYELNHTLLNIYVAPSMSTKGFSLQNLLSASRTSETKQPVTISKRMLDLTGKKTTKLVGGAELKLYDLTGGGNEEVATIETNASADWSGSVYPGTYKLVETSAPKGYALESEPVIFTVGADGSVTIAGENKNQNADASGNTAIMYDKLESVTVNISKVAVTGGPEIEGAKLTVKKDTGETWDWTSGTEPKVLTGLGAGTYTLTENLAPLGYAKATTITFVINADGSVTGADGSNKIEMVDEVITVSLSKKAVNGTEELDGAELKLLDKDGNPAKTADGTEIEPWVSGGSPRVIKMLVPGIYKMVETDAPKGYEVSEDIVFEIDEYGKIKLVSGSNGVVDGKVVTMKDATTPEVKFTVSKYGTDTNKKDLAGAKFVIVKGARSTEEIEAIQKAEAEKAAQSAPASKMRSAAKSESPYIREWMSGSVAEPISLLVPKELGEQEFTLIEAVAPEGYDIDKVGVRFKTVRYKEDGIVKARLDRYDTATGKWITEAHLSITDKSLKDPTPTPTPKPKPTPTPTPTPTPAPYDPGTPAVTPTSTTTGGEAVLGAARGQQQVLGAMRTVGSPNTGDDAPVMLLLVVMGACVACAVVCYIRWIMSARSYANARRTRRHIKARRRK